MNDVPAFPLSWPHGRPRTPAHRRGRAKFSSKRQALSVASGRDRALAELGRFGARAVVISSNLRLRLDGSPLGSQSNPEDPGVAIYFTLSGKPRVIACDHWDRAADNMAAIAATIEAQRAMLRHGAVTAEQIFEGFKALPTPNTAQANNISSIEEAAMFVASVGGDSYGNVLNGREAFKAAYKRAAMKLHPDPNNGATSPEWNKLQQAKELLDRRHAGP